MYEQGNDFSVGYALGRDNNGYGNGCFGGDWIWAIILIALLGNGGWGFGGGFGGNGGFMNYEIGRLATTNDVASGFNNSAVLSSLNDIKLGQSQMQNFINQGFSGINTSLLQGFHGVDNAICTLGYQTSQGFNTLGHQISDCCCATQRAIDGVNYNMAKNTCDIVTNQNANTQRILDFMTGEKIATLQAENAGLKAQISNDKQSAYLLSELKACPVPAYVVPNPNCGCGCSCGL